MAALGEMAGGGLSAGGNVVKAATSSAAILFTLGHTFFRVREGEVALKENGRGKVRREALIDRHGEAHIRPKIYETGVHAVFPGLQHHKIVPIQKQVSRVEDIAFTRAESNVTYIAEPWITWRILKEGAYSALYDFDTRANHETRAISIGRQAIQQELLACPEGLLLTKNLRNQIREPVIESCRDELLEECGVVLKGLELVVHKHPQEINASATRYVGDAIRETGQSFNLGALAVVLGESGEPGAPSDSNGH